MAFIAIRSYKDQLIKLQEEISKRKLSEEILRNSENLYKQLVAFSSDLIIVLENGKITYINPGGVKLLGYKNHEELLNKDYISLVSFEQRDETSAQINSIISGKDNSLFIEEKLIKKDLSEIYIERGFFPYLSKTGLSVLLIGKNLMDIKRTQEALQKSEERFKMIVQNIQEYVYSGTYQNGTVVSNYHSPKCTQITGFTPEEYNSDPDLWIKMVHPEDRDWIYILFEKFTENIQSTVEHRIIHKNGTERWISNTFTVEIDKNNLYRIDGFILDITERVNSEKVLKEQNVFLQRLIDNIPNPIFYKEINSGFKLINTAFEEFLGISKDYILNKNITELNSPLLNEFSVKVENGIWSKDELTGKEIEISTDVFNKNFLFNKVNFMNEKDEQYGVLGILVDISNLKNVQNELNASLSIIKEIEKIINKSPVVVLILTADENLSVNYISENISQFKYDRNEILDRKIKFLDLIYPEDKKQLTDDLILFSFDPANDFNEELRIITPDNQIKWIDCRLWKVKDEKEKIKTYQGILTDITERKLAELLLKESREKYKTITENSYDLICELNSKNHFIYVSPNFGEVLNYSHEELLEKNIIDFVHIDDLPGFLTELKKEAFQVNFRFKQSNGEWLWFEGAGKRFKSANARERCVFIARDISERKKIEEQLIQSEKLMAIGEMSAMIAHEFRNSLTSIKMILQLHSEIEVLTEGQKKSLFVALNSIKHMEDVVKQLLNYAHPVQMDLQICDLNSIINECSGFPIIQAKRKFIQVIKKFDKSLPPVLLHSASIKDAVFNLLINAVQAFENTNLKVWKRIYLITKKIILEETVKDYDFSYGQGSLAIKKKNQKDQQVILPKGSECIYIEINDNACGIDENILSRIFEPFVTTKEKGSGLGLPTVKRTINAHGGIICVESKVNVGTVFKIYLPLKLSS